MVGVVFAMAAGAATMTAVQPVAQCADKAGPLIAFSSPDGRMRGVVAPQRGGALVSLTLDGKELLYRGMDFCEREGWDGKAPVLWPATGRNYAVDPAAMPAGSPPEAAYSWLSGGKKYFMPQHGFARFKPWHLDATSRHSVRVSLSDNASTRTDYPFGFRLTVDYSLSGHQLTVRHRVSASPRNKVPMPFSIGNHITFATAGEGNAAAKISTPASLVQPADRFGRTDGPARAHDPLNGVTLAELGVNKALALGGYRPGAVTASMALIDGPRITLTQSGPPAPRRDAVRFTLWGDQPAGYFAIEPWYGRQNSLGTGDGIAHVRPGGVFKWDFTVAVERQPN